jgi:undecaprenyl-diphosphatase
MLENGENVRSEADRSRSGLDRPLASPGVSKRRVFWLFAAALVVVVFFPIRAFATTVASNSTTDTTAAGNELTAGKAAVLGLVEGVTEFLPISSTGHLLVAQRLMDIGTTDATKTAADAYAIAIQSGAILAVVLLYWRRLWSMAEGLVGRDTDGRRTLIGLVVAVIPAAVIGLALEGPIKDHLLEVGPVIAAWIIGGLVILLLAPRLMGSRHGVALEQITVRQAIIIGLVQCLALWPGTSRSLVTILAALAVGLSLSAAVEFSFLLGLVTLGAATFFEIAKDGSTMIDAYGWVNPLIGFVVAFGAAAVAIKWMVGYLQHHSLAIFGWYRLVIAGVALILLATGAL